MSDVNTQSVEEFRKALQDEYGTFVAISPIDHDGARAYNPGDPVPVSNVTEYKYDEQGLVAKRTTKAAKQATGTDA
jgi:hypothetical protein